MGLSVRPQEPDGNLPEFRGRGGARDCRALARVGRLERDPRTAEEEVVHDAMALESLGAYGISRMLLDGYRERRDFGETADAIDEAAKVPLRTEAGRALAAPRVAAMKDFSRRLREEYREFAPEEPVSQAPPFSSS